MKVSPLLVSFALPLLACGGITQGSSAGGPGEGATNGGDTTSGGGSTSSGSTTSSSSPPSSCPTPTPSELLANDNGAGQSVGAGSAEGPMMSCTLCGVGVVLSTLRGSSGASLNVSSAANDAGFSIGGGCSTPGNTVAGSLLVFGEIFLRSASPGTYTMEAPSDWNPSLMVSYWTPNPDAVDCGNAVAPNCINGCGSSCGISDAGEFCSPCEPGPGGSTTIDTQFIAQPAQEGIPQAGSWTVTLTSVTPYSGDAGVEDGEANYVVHGSISANLTTGAESPTSTNGTSVTITF
jgi:hypothetical protein